MSRLWFIGLSALLAHQCVEALPSPTPLSTTFRHAAIPASTPMPTRAVHRRDYSDPNLESFHELGVNTTETMLDSVCGYIDGIWNTRNEIRCNGGQTCVWHTSESAFDGMFGCCPQSAYKQCSFFGTCYDSARLSASPSLKSNNPKSELYCTESDSPHCVTYMWTELSILDYNCGATKTTWTAVTWATTSLSEEWSVLATKIPATVDAPFLSLWSSETQTLSQTQSPMKAVPTSSSGQPGEPSTRPKVVSSSQVASKGSNSSTSAGTIAGSVVGGVLGVSGFAAAGFMFFLIRKRKRKGKSNTEAGAGQDGYQSVPRDGSPSGHDLHQSMNVYGPGTVKVNGAEEHDSKHNPSEVGESAVASQVHEIDGRQFVAELPAREEGKR